MITFSEVCKSIDNHDYLFWDSRYQYYSAVFRIDIKNIFNYKMFPNCISHYIPIIKYKKMCGENY